MTKMAVSRNCVALVAMVTMILAVSEACPRGCHCSPKGSFVVTVCVASNFTSVPDGIPANTNELYMTDQRIEVLKENSFPGLTKLQKLSLTDCGIFKIESGAFSGLSELEELNLQNNKLTELKGSTFSGLSSLHTLHLSQNKLENLHEFVFRGLRLTFLYLEHNARLWNLAERVFEGSRVEALYLYNNSLNSDSAASLRHLKDSLKELHWQHNKIPLFLPRDMFQGFSFRVLKLNWNGISDIRFLGNTKADDLSLEYNPTGPINFSQFESLNSVRTLRLSNTQFMDVDSKFFTGMTDLNTLYLSKNGITSFSHELETLFSGLERLLIDGNNLHCNCELIWFKRWVSNTLVDVQGAKCTTPKQQSIKTMNVTEMTCTKPKITSFSRSVNISDTGDVTFNCSASGDPSPEIRWLGPKGLIEAVEPEVNRSKQTNMAVVTIKATSKHHVGRYTCLAFNVAGNDSRSTSVDTYVVIDTPGSANVMTSFSVYMFVITLFYLLFT